MSRQRATVQFALLAALVLAFALAPAVAQAKKAHRGQKVLLGAQLYFDAALSQPDGQACADCHQPFAGYADPERALPVSEGVVPIPIT
jgi:cytochrome c peroxidase